MINKDKFGCGGRYVRSGRPRGFVPGYAVGMGLDVAIEKLLYARILFVSIHYVVLGLVGWRRLQIVEAWG